MTSNQHPGPRFYYPENEGRAARTPGEKVVGASGDMALYGAHVQIDGGAPRETFHGGPGSVNALPLHGLEEGGSQERVFARPIAERVHRDGIDAIHHVVRMGDTLVGVTTTANRAHSVKKVRLVALPYGHEMKADGEQRTGRIISEWDAQEGATGWIELGRSVERGAVVVNDDPTISGVHATFYLRRDGFTVRDGATIYDGPAPVDQSPDEWRPSTNGTAVSNLRGLGETSQAADLAAQLQAHPEIWDGRYQGSRIVTP